MRTYIDVGDTVSFVSDDATIDLGCKMDTQDEYGRFHDILYVEDVGADVVQPATTYDVVVSGSGDFPAETFEDLTHVPADTEITFPTMRDHMVIYSDQDFRLEWDTEAAGAFDFAFVAFSDQYGPVGFCIGPQSGFMTIPLSFVERMPPGGRLQHGTLSHQVVEREGRRLDFVGINCREMFYEVDIGGL